MQLLATSKTRNRRLKVCRSCEHYVERTSSCGPLLTEAFTDSELCGCHMPTKARLRTASCPLGKWHAQVSQELLADLRALVQEYEGQRHLPAEATDRLQRLHAAVLGTAPKFTSCSSCLRNMWAEIQQLVADAD